MGCYQKEINVSPKGREEKYKVEEKLRKKYEGKNKPNESKNTSLSSNNWKKKNTLNETNLNKLQNKKEKINNKDRDNKNKKIIKKKTLHETKEKFYLLKERRRK